MTRRRLPIGIQTFRKIREERCYYVDKTAYIRELLDTGTHYFLSRPRRFGKSLFLDTLKELFEGSERLFEGLDIHAHRDWSVRHPVLRLSFGSGNFKAPDATCTRTSWRNWMPSSVEPAWCRSTPRRPSASLICWNCSTTWPGDRWQC